MCFCVWCACRSEAEASAKEAKASETISLAAISRDALREGFPTDAVKIANTPCRAAVSACDVEDKCDGISLDCPADAVAPEREVDLCVRNGAGALEQDCILAVAGDFSDKVVQAFRICRG